MKVFDDFKIDLLAFAAHPDDAEICCGGFLAKAHALGQRTGVVDLSHGERSTGGDLDTRKKETELASQHLGLTVRKNLGFPDGGINSLSGTGKESQETGSQLHQVVKALRELRPETVLVPYWEERHPDHVQSSHLLTRALFFAGVAKFDTGIADKRFIPRQVIYYQMRYEFRPSFIVDVTTTYDRKTAAIAAYRSQLNRPGLKPEEQTLLSSPLASEVIEVRDRYYGAMIGVRYAEAYLVRNALAIEDPVKFFRENATFQPLIYPAPL